MRRGGGRLCAALLLSAAMALGGTPAAALAEEGIVQPEGTEAQEGTVSPERDPNTIPSPVTTLVKVTEGDTTVEGDIEVKNNSPAATVESRNGDTSLTVDGSVNISNEGDWPAIGVNLSNPQGKASVTVGGDVTASSEGGTAIGARIELQNADTDASLTVGGDLKASSGGGGYALLLFDSGQWNSNTSVSTPPKATVTVLGTIDGGRGGTDVLVNSNAAEGYRDNVTLNVWRISDPNSIEVELSQLSSADPAAATIAFKKSINYIVKAAGLGREGYGSLGIKLKDDNLSKPVTVNGASYDSINSGKTLRFTVTPPAGKRVKAVYGYYAGEGSGVGAEAAIETLTPGADGVYAVLVKDGGGINLYVEYESDDAGDAPTANGPVAEVKVAETRAEEAEAQPESAEHVRLASTGAAPATHALPATGDAASVLPAAMLALAGAGSLVAGRRGRRE